MVSSLWSVEDVATGQLMVQFYASLRRGSRKDDALREAQLFVLTRMGKNGPARPALWAAFQLTGATKPLG